MLYHLFTGIPGIPGIPGNTQQSMGGAMSGAMGGPMGSHLIMPDGSTIVRPQLMSGGIPAGIAHQTMVRPGTAVSMSPLIDQFNRNPGSIIGGHPMRPGGHQGVVGHNTAGLERFFGIANQQGMQGNAIPPGRAQNIEDLEGMSLT